MVFAVLLTFIVFKMILSVAGKDVSQRNRSFIAFAVFCLGFGLYFPNLMFVLAMNEDYLTAGSQSFGLDALSNGLSRFDFSPMVRAFFVQTEPLTYPLLILALISVFSARSLKLSQKSSLWTICMIVLPVTSILEILVFQATSAQSYRPPYAIYLLPLTLILASVGFHGIWIALCRSAGLKRLRIVLVLVALFLLAATTHSFLLFKAVPKKSDWRGLATYLHKTCGPEQVLLFDSLNRYGSWEPTFYGFDRYYCGDSTRIPMGRLPFLPPKAIHWAKEPVLILFQYRPYYLTPHSVYPFISLSPEMKQVNYDKIAENQLFDVTEFTGFSFIRLKRVSNDFVSDTYRMIATLIQDLPHNSSLVDLHLSKALLGKSLNVEGWGDHLTRAEALVSGQERDWVHKVGNSVKKRRLFDS